MFGLRREDLSREEGADQMCCLATEVDGTEGDTASGLTDTNGSTAAAAARARVEGGRFPEVAGRVRGRRAFLSKRLRGSLCLSAKYLRIKS